MNNRNHAQKGSTLIISLLILVVMTLIGLTGIASSTLEEKMSGNTRDQVIAFQAAEAALRDGEEYFREDIDSLASAFDGNTVGQYKKETNPDLWDDATWGNSRVFSGNITGVKQKPRYIIEFLGPIAGANEDPNLSGGYDDSSGAGTVNAVRITARAVGGTNNTVVMLQSNFAKVF